MIGHIIGFLLMMFSFIGGIILLHSSVMWVGLIGLGLIVVSLMILNEGLFPGGMGR